MIVILGPQPKNPCFFTPQARILRKLRMTCTKRLAGKCVTLV